MYFYISRTDNEKQREKLGAACTGLTSKRSNSLLWQWKDRQRIKLFGRAQIDLNEQLGTKNEHLDVPNRQNALHAGRYWGLLASLLVTRSY